MNRLNVLAVLFLAVALLTAGCANCPVHRYLFKSEEAKGGGQSPLSTAEAVKVTQKTCPVMGGTVDPNVFVDHEGRRVYFCCPGCKGTFRKDPGKYLSKLDAAAEPKSR